MTLFAKAQTFTPLFHTDDIRKIFTGKSVTLKEGILKELEMIAFPNTSFTLLSSPREDHIVAVRTEEYPTASKLWTDVRFLKVQTTPTEEREKHLPTTQEIITSMMSMLGLPYLWGGNCQGVPQMLDFFFPSIPLQDLDDNARKLWSLHGVDCSGLLFYSTNGVTPRNTSELVYYGNKVSNLDVKPLDLIVWKGHVIIAIDRDTVIESLGGKGVIITELKTRLNEIENELHRSLKEDWSFVSKENENMHFVIRRWHPEQCR